jgi:hypothetical protein
MGTGAARHPLQITRRAAVALASVLLLAGSSVVSCKGDPFTDGTADDRRPASAAMGQWTPSSQDTCTARQHEDVYVLAPDGKKYPTWHAPTGEDDAGAPCRYGHEHGTDPRTSALWSALQEHFYFDANRNGVLDRSERDRAGVPFGYLDEQLRAFNGQQRPHAHVSYKVFVANAVPRLRRVNGQLQSARDVTCDALVAFSQDTYTEDAFANAQHAVIYAIDCAGTGAADSYRTRLIVSAIATFGTPLQPGGDRVVPTLQSVSDSVWVPAGQNSDYRAGLSDDWATTVQITRADGSILARFDLRLRNFSPSRLRENLQLARAISVCHRGVNAAGQVVDDPGQAGSIVRQARGGLCAAMTPAQTPATPLSQRIAFDSRDSALNGCQREVVLGSIDVRNTGGPNVWYTDPFGANARTTPFTGGVKQYIGASTPANVTLEPETRDAGACGAGIHVPN